MTHLLPVNKIIENDLLVAFYHPQPVHKVHILIVPKKKIRNWMNITKEDFPVLNEIILISQELVIKFNLDPQGYRLLVNGGAYQDIDHLHFHLVSDG